MSGACSFALVGRGAVAGLLSLSMIVCVLINDLLAKDIGFIILVYKIQTQIAHLLISRQLSNCFIAKQVSTL